MKGPYLQFNFLIDLGDGGSPGPHAGFQECSNLAKENTAEVTLKRGIIDSSVFSRWLTDIRDGARNANRTVKIHLQSENYDILETWKLLRARVVKHTTGSLVAQGNQIAIEELVVACERLEIS